MDIPGADIRLGHKKIMENFTPESLKRFINQGSSPQGAPQMPGARGQRVSETLRHSGGQAQGGPNSNANLDTLIRQNMGELVRKYVQAGKLEELKNVMEEHRSFIDEILGLIQNSMQK